MDIFILNVGFAVLVLISFLDQATAMECYVCTKQEGNVEKCLSTVRTCDSSENTCLTEVRWGSTPYWSQGAEKQYYVTKTCATQEYCNTRREQFVNDCHRIWYEDWKCAECCQGDRCNYFVFMGAGNISVSWIFTAISATFAILWQYHS